MLTTKDSLQRGGTSADYLLHRVVSSVTKSLIGQLLEKFRPKSDQSVLLMPDNKTSNFIVLKLLSESLLNKTQAKNV